MVRIFIKIQQIFSDVVLVSDSSQTLILLILRMLRWQTSQFNGINRVLVLFINILFSLLVLGKFTDLFMLFILVDNFFVHV